MKFPYSMLLDFVDTRLDAEQIGDLLTMAGFELEGIEEVQGDQVLDIKVVSNRGDGLSVFGLSREVLAKDPEAKPTALYLAAASRFSDLGSEGELQLGDEVVAIEAEECHRFACRAFDGVRSDSSSPDWMQLRLTQAGMRPISLLVDLTNYVMLELGQPLHAFDRDLLHEGRIVVRHARPGEQLTTLNGEEHELDGQMMICDADRPVGVPGVMGGLETEVTDATHTVLLESANFQNTTVRKTRKQLGLATEASYRFERSVDPEGVVAAIRRFTQLLKQAAPSVTVSNIVDRYPGKVVRKPLRLRGERLRRLLGVDVTTAQADDYLRRLGMQVEPVSAEVLSVVPPSWRPDIVREDDLVEEVGRVHGYDLIPEKLPEGTTTLGGPQGFELWTDMVREAAVRAGLIQSISHSLRDLHPLDAPGKRIGPRNPASPETAYLRNSLLPSLADTVRRNGGKDIYTFEIGQVFSEEEGYRETTHLGIIVTGTDFFGAKGIVESILEAGAIRARFEPNAEPDQRMHPTRQARMTVNGEGIGFIGLIHPDVAEQAGLPSDTMLAEIELPAAYAVRSTEIDLHPVSRFPAVRRDISIQIEKQVPYEKVAEAVRGSVGDLLERQWLFDIYEGKGIPEGSHSLAIALQLRKQDGTFTDEEANQVRDRAVEALAGLGAIRR